MPASAQPQGSDSILKFLLDDLEEETSIKKSEALQKKKTVRFDGAEESKNEKLGMHSQLSTAMAKLGEYSPKSKQPLEERVYELEMIVKAQ